METEPDFEQSSVKEACPDCKLGHCSCYYTNQNYCCRCNRYQYDRKLIERKVIYDDLSEYSDVKKKSLPITFLNVIITKQTNHTRKVK